MDPFLLIIIVFIVAPLIERILKAGKQQPPGAPGQRLPPGQRQPPQQRPQLPQSPRRPTGQPQARLPRSADEDEEDAAAGMLPDDLWEILTGERRTPQPSAPPVPQPAPGYEPEPAYESRYESDYGTALEPYETEPALAEEEEVRAALPELYERELPVRAPPRVVSLEELSFDSDRRHDQFHDRLDRLPGAATVARRAVHDYRFTSRADARRAFIMAEILGTPKGLEPPGSMAAKGLEPGLRSD